MRFDNVKLMLITIPNVFSFYSLKRKRQLKFTSDKTPETGTPPLPYFPEDLLAENEDIEMAKKMRKESNPESGMMNASLLSHTKLFRVACLRFRGRLWRGVGGQL